MGFGNLKLLGVSGRVCFGAGEDPMAAEGHKSEDRAFHFSLSGVTFLLWGQRERERERGSVGTCELRLFL